MDRRQRLVNLGVAAVIAIAAVVLIVAIGGDNAEDSPAPEPTPEIVVEDGEPVGGVARLEFDQDERVRFSVTADVEDEIHVHAYDITMATEPGKPVEFDFQATITGIAEIELEGAGVQIAELRVNP